MSNLYLVCGIGGGGKTVLSHRIIEKNPGMTLLDPDMYYAKIYGDECNRGDAFPVWHQLFGDLHKLELEGKDVVLSTNALTYCQRSQFVEWFPSFTKHIIWVTSPWDRCVEGNAKRRRHIPEAVLKKQWHDMEFPSGKEPGWETVTHVTNHWTCEYNIDTLKGDIRKWIIF